MKNSFFSFLLSAALMPICLFGSNMQIYVQSANGKLITADKNLKHCKWMKEKAETALYGGVSGKVNEWNQASFEFIPEKDGKVILALKGPFGSSKPLDQWSWVIYDNIRVNGKFLPNGGFEEDFKKWRPGTLGKLRLMPQIVEDPMMVKSGKRAVRVWHNGLVTTKIPVKAGEKVWFFVGL